MDSLSNQYVMRNKEWQYNIADGVLAETEIVCYYFSAHWCPPCRMFTPILADFYRDLKDQNAPVEVVFVSSDRSEQEMLSYMLESHADWLAVQWGSPTAASLKSKYNVTGIPALIVVKKNGAVISTDGRSDVQRFGASCYQQWKRC